MRKFMWKQSVFLKIHLSFWFTTILIIATQISIDRLMDPHPMDRLMFQHLNSSLLLYGEAVAGKVAAGDAEAVQRITNDLDNATGITAYLLNSSFRDAANRKISPEAAGLAELSMQSLKTETLNGKNSVLMATPVTLQDNGQYVVLGEMRRGPYGMPPGGALRLAQGLFVILVISGFVCYLLARYLTSPIIALRNATRSVASGDLSVRIAHTLGNRKDEISELACDFDHMTERIEMLVSSQKQLIGDISHELRSPLARLNVALELVRRYTGPEAEKALARIEKEAVSLNQLIGHLLMLTRIKSGDDMIRMETVDLTALVKEIAADGNFEAQGNNRNVLIFEAEPCVARGNPELLRQAVENIVRNAIRYTFDATSVEIRLIKVETVLPPYAEISVRDHGPGVPEEDLPNIFLPFFRLSDSRERKTGGTGLGLAIAERAVLLHSGILKAANAPGGGLMVTMHLPL